MALFWFLAGALSTLALVILLLPWLRRIPTLGPLPRVSWPLLAVAMAILAAGIGLYLRFGRPDLIASGSARGAAAPKAISMPAMPPKTDSSTGTMPNAGGSMNSAIASLEARLAKGGGGKDDWELLAKSYEFLGRPADAALARAHQLPPLPGAGADLPASGAASMPAAVAPKLTAQSLKRLAEASAARRDHKYASAVAIYADLAAHDQMNADAWADYADSKATVQGNKLAGEPESYIARALALDPEHPKALWLKASAAEEAGRWSDAVPVWRQLAAELDPASSDAKIVAANLQRDTKLAGGASVGGMPAAASATPMAGGAAATPAAGAHAAAISGEVSVADSLRGRAGSQATLFIVAKSVDSPGMPVAVIRTTASSWPVRFTLDDSQAMMPGRNLSSAGHVTVEARISGSGQATPASGDLQGTSPVIDPAAHQPLNIVIDRVIP